MMRILVLLITPLTLAFANFIQPHIPASTQKACIATLCNEIGNRNCNKFYRYEALVDACTRQLDLQCVNSSLNILSKNETDEIDEVISLAKSCQYVYANAFEKASSELSKYDKDELAEIKSLNSSLWLATTQCLTDSFSQLKRSDKDELGEVRALANFCTGTYDFSCFQKECARNSCDDSTKVKKALYKCVSGPSKQDRRKL